MARAIVNHPPVLLADEPTGNLDTRNTHEVMRLLKSLNEGGATIVMVTHSNECARYAGRLLRLSDGCLAEDETPQRLAGASAPELKLIRGQAS